MDACKTGSWEACRLVGRLNPLTWLIVEVYLDQIGQPKFIVLQRSAVGPSIHRLSNLHKPSEAARHGTRTVAGRQPKAIFAATGASHDVRHIFLYPLNSLIVNRLIV